MFSSHELIDMRYINKIGNVIKLESDIRLSLCMA